MSTVEVELKGLAMVRIVVIALLVVLAFTGSASAECAWVMWSRVMIGAPSGESVDSWDPLDSFKTRQECSDSERLMRAKVQQRMKTATSDRGIQQVVTLTCLPDTVDPRGPKR